MALIGFMVTLFAGVYCLFVGLSFGWAYLAFRDKGAIAFAALAVLSGGALVAAAVANAPLPAPTGAAQ